MGVFKNQITCPGPTIPEYLINKIEIRATFPITKHEAFLFSVALHGISIKLEQEFLEKEKLPRLCALLTERGNFEFEELDVDDSIGFRFNLAVYCVGKWREKNYDDELILMVFLEELVHHYWNLEDEVITKEKVIEIMNLVLDYDISIGKIYSVDWLNDYLISQGNEPRF
ncbi:hypothetical protein D5E69_14155 [Rossellomorea marisflavi]|uniref:hypothetical protein n=1 Tax=Rossellomorea marisflavi TaxID=189381 RepID=UPI001316D073|nr:hypothetical protein [Rossellomorea marisflavi]QHA36844.1 hypothetical protein D5E69_14155 [Rossellomorea marisflavi]